MSSVSGKPAMAPAAGTTDEGILVRLSVEGQDAFFHPHRHVRLTRENPSIPVGRASKTASKGFTSSPENAWFDSRVMSRTHAEIHADVDAKTIHIKDIGSLHGTFINGEEERIPTGTPRLLKDGDEVRFGVPIYSGAESYPPLSIGVGVEYFNVVLGAGEREDVLSSPNGRIFRVSAPDYTEDSDEEEVFNMQQTPTAVDLTRDEDETASRRQRRVDDHLIDLTSPAPASPDLPAQRPSDSHVPATMEHHPPLLIELEQTENVPSTSMGYGFTSDDDSLYDARTIHLTDLGDGMQLGNSEDGSGMDSAGDLSDDDHARKHRANSSSDSEEQEDVSTDDYSSDEEGSEVHDDAPLWDAESEDLDVEDEFDADFAATLAPKHLPPISSVFEFPPLPPIPPVIREPSPTDVVMPKSCLNGSNKSTAEALGVKTGKHEYFEARQANKMTALRQGLSSPYPSPPGPATALEKAVPSSSQTLPAMEDARGVVFSACVEAPKAEQEIASGPSDSGEAQAAEPYSDDTVIATREEPADAESSPLMPELEPSVPVYSSPAPELPSSFLREPPRSSPLRNPWLKTGERFLNSPHEPRPLVYERSESEEAMTSAFAFHQYKMAMAASHVYPRPSGDGKCTQVATASVTTCSKRKAEDISSMSQKETAWEAKRLLQIGDKEARKTKDAIAPAGKKPAHGTGQKLAAIHSRLMSSSGSPLSAADGHRPTKKLKTIAERLAYAALGGATVTAAVLTGLIYTAPSLA